MKPWHLVELTYKEDVSSFFCWLNQSFPYAVWLDSCASKTEGRYDIISANPQKRLLRIDNRTLVIDGKNKIHIDAEPLEALQQLVPDDEDLPKLPFTHGAIGYVSYDYGLELLCLKQHHEALFELPSVEFGIYQWSVVIDHKSKTSYLFYLAECDEAFIDGVLTGWDRAYNHPGDFALRQSFAPLMKREEYASSFDEIKNNLGVGNCYQVNLTHRFKANYQGEALKAYLNVRRVNPMPYAAFMSVNKAEILSFSPELFFKATDDKVMTQPIKGTAKVLADIEQDKFQQKKLLSCIKNRAENLMIVDLLRNDMSRVSKPHSVHVSAFSELKTFRGVHHLVSTINSKLCDNETHISLFKALFPGGSITGAPKIAAMKLIDELESNRRHVYCGAIGYFSANRKCQFNIAIRTLVAKNKSLYCAAGGGIVVDSKEEDEYQESLDKIAVITTALQSRVC